MVFKTTIIAAFVASASLASAAVAAPQASEPYRITRKPWVSTPSLSTQAAPTVTPAVVPTKVEAALAGPSSMTLTLINGLTHAISTTHGPNADSTLPATAMPGPGMMAPGAKGTWQLGPGYAGNVGVAKGSFLGDESLLEYSFKESNEINKVSINVSYVTGFNFNIHCTCSGASLVGCTELLWNNANLCPKLNADNTCVNPKRGDESATTPDPFFKPCFGKHKAYTFPHDHNAVSVGDCTTGDVTCTILTGGR